MKKAYCYGHISTGKLYRIKNSYPPPNGYGEIIDVSDNYCGEALGTSIVLNRLGISVELEGNWIGDTESGRRTYDFIRNEGIGNSGIIIKKGYQGVDEVVISDQNSRTVFGRYENLLFTKRQWEFPDEQKIVNSHIVCADSSFGEASLTVAKLATKNSIPFVGIDSTYDSEVCKLSDVLIVSEDFLKLEYAEEDYHKIFNEYQNKCPGLIVFTFGAEPLWYGKNSKNKHKPFKVEVIETAGAGDSFRAGVMYGMLNNYSDEDMIKFAAAVSASVIQTYPGVVNFRGIDEVEAILNQNTLNQSIKVEF